MDELAYACGRDESNAHFMATVSDPGDLLRESLAGVSWDKPRCFDFISCAKIQESIDANKGAKDTARNLDWIYFRAVLRIDPVVVSDFTTYR